MNVLNTIKEVGDVLKKIERIDLYKQLIDLNDKYFKLQQERDRLYQENKKLKDELNRVKGGPLEPTEIIDVYDFGDDY